MKLQLNETLCFHQNHQKLTRVSLYSYVRFSESYQTKGPNVLLWIAKAKSNLPNCLLLQEWHNNFILNSSDKKNRSLKTHSDQFSMFTSRDKRKSTKGSREWQASWFIYCDVHNFTNSHFTFLNAKLHFGFRQWNLQRQVHGCFYFFLKPKFWFWDLTRTHQFKRSFKTPMKSPRAAHSFDRWKPNRSLLQ